LEGANNPVTDGDMLSHRQMYYGLQKAFPLVNIISEEEDVEETDMSKIKDASISDQEVDRIIPDSEDIIVPAKVKEYILW
jgi:inositol monophosphatase 3